jgi:two-component system chemotaxis response regulator CheB
VNIDYSVPLVDIAPLLVKLTSVPVEATNMPVPDQMDIEVKIAMEQNPIEAGLERIGEPSSFACPECHGVLLQLKEGSRTRFRCHTGHAFSIASLLAAITEGIEDSLWNAIRALEEGQLLMCRIAEHMKISHSATEADLLTERADEAKRQSDIIRKLVTEREALSLNTK